jgi:hypothetical protein
VGEFGRERCWIAQVDGRYDLWKWCEFDMSILTIY